VKRPLFDDEAKQRKAEGQKAGGKSGGKGRPKLGGKNATKLSHKPRDAAGKAVGEHGKKKLGGKSATKFKSRDAAGKAVGEHHAAPKKNGETISSFAAPRLIPVFSATGKQLGVGSKEHGRISVHLDTLPLDGKLLIRTAPPSGRAGEEGDG
jgi:hypothetical protein